jgi:alpha 1,6-mannosyltransferase
MITLRLYGDILVLPIDAFSSGVGHSGAVASPGDKVVLVTHNFQGSWREVAIN